jgi:hypothetical protein
MQNQQGAGQADLIGGQATNLNSLYQAAVNGDVNARTQLAQLLQNTNMQGANMATGTPNVQQQPTNYLGQVGQIAGGIAGALGGFSQDNGQVTNGANAGYGPFNNQTTGYGPNYSTPYNPQLLAGVGLRDF